ncbi:hypothetical protein [Yersinia enterocolitica]|uniref:hypothetical protein n=1 Tax=Yersinia enterocolitica TaxID=630 RepID=UPI0030D06B4B|nr:hypothetical protein [Yersinia enterocolitica]
MKKVLFGISALAMSFTALAGGGGSSWQPSVSPGYCVTAPWPQEEIKWRDIKECQEVITKGYARGVTVSGVAVYEGGQITYGYFGAVTPSRGFTMDVPKSIDGVKFKGIASTQYQWIK